MNRAQARSNEVRAAAIAIRPMAPTTTPDEALRGVLYEDMPVRVGSAAAAVSRGYALPRIHGERRVFGSSAALCADGGAGLAFKVNRRGPE